MKPVLIILAGKAGTGKTTLAKRLSNELSLCYLDYDTINQPYLEAIENRYGLEDSDRYGLYRKWREQSYQAVLDPAMENINLGVSLIISAPLTRELQDRSWPEHLKRRAKRDFSLVVFYMAPPETVHIQMVKERNSHRDEDFINNSARFSSTYSAEKPVWDDQYIVILDSGNLERNLEIAKKRAMALMEG